MSVASTPRVDLSYRAYRASPETKKPDLAFVRRLLETFGPYYIDQIRDKLKSKDRGLFDKVYPSYMEIQKKLQDGPVAYHPTALPLTRAVIGYHPKLEAGYEDLERGSYEVLPFSQKILTYKRCNEEVLREIEGVRKRAFAQMIGGLRGSQNLPVEEELALTHLYYNGGAIVHQGKTVYFSELIGHWQGESRVQFLESLTMRDWVEERPNKTLNFKGADSFKEFLVQCSIDVLQNHLRVEFSASLRKIFSDAFQDEGIRSDVDYFIARGGVSSEFPDRPSKPYLLAMGRFILVARGAEQAPILLEMLIRQRDQPLPKFEAGQIEAFSDALSGLDLLLQLFGEENLKGAPLYWDFLYLLWKHPRRDFLVTTLSPFCKQEGVKLSVQRLYRFCKENENVPDHFTEVYLKVLKVLGDNHIDFRDGEALFLDSDRKLPDEFPTVEDAVVRTKEFVEHMRQYESPKDRRYLLLLRHYILKPFGWVFPLLEDTVALGIANLSRELLEEILFAAGEPIAVAPAIREKVRQIGRQLKERYGFADAPTFLLYLEILRQKEPDTVMRATSHLISELESFTPDLKKNVIYFLYRYHPPVPAEAVSYLRKLKEEWKKDLDRLTIEPGGRTIEQLLDILWLEPMGRSLTEIEAKIKNFIAPLSQACPVEAEQGVFTTALNKPLRQSFFLAFQPLNEYFCIKDIAGGISWLNAEVATHLGQLKFVLGETVGVHLHWDIYKDRPTLSISFLNAKKKIARSAFLSLDISANRLAKDPDRRRKFYGDLFALGMHLFNENMDNTLNAAITMAKEEFGENVALTIMEFFTKTKIAYQTLFIDALTDTPCSLPYNPRKVAALGHIFQSHPQGALIPEFLLRTEPPECYIPDAGEESGSLISDCMHNFQNPNDRPQSLNTNLVVSSETNEKVELPISYHVQDVEGVTLEWLTESQQKDFAESKPKSEKLLEVVDSPSYVTLSVIVNERKLTMPLQYAPSVLSNREAFLALFRYHLLRLKAAVYYELTCDEGA